VSFPRLFVSARNDYECRALSSVRSCNGWTFWHSAPGGEIKLIGARASLLALDD
jgi:hypothetical protein